MLCGNRHRCTSDLSIQSNKRVLYNILHNIVFNAQARERPMSDSNCLTSNNELTYLTHTLSWRTCQCISVSRNLFKPNLATFWNTHPKSPNISISTFWENPVLWSWFLWGPNPTNRRTRCRWHNGWILLDRWHLRGHHSLRRPGDVVIWEGRRLLLLLCQVFFDACKYVTYSYLYYDCALNIYDMKYGDLQYCKVGKMQTWSCRIIKKLKSSMIELQQQRIL